MKNIDKKLNIVLTIIIIILLMIIIFLVLKKSNGETIINNEGNINVFEIKCDVKCNCPTIDNKCDDNSNSNNNPNIKPVSENTNNNEEEQELTISIFDNEKKWEEHTNIKLFENSSYTVKGKIAPESTGIYQFAIKNTTTFNVKYNIEFTETNNKNIDIKYRLKKNNEYIISDWVTYSELKQQQILLKSNIMDTYSLEWKWFEGPDDNLIGSDISSKYELSINIRADQVDE